METRPGYSVVAPVFNEEEVLPLFYERMTAVLKGLNAPYELIFIDDGSKDRTREMATEICKNDPSVRLIGFSRNFGHAAAITAGMARATGDVVIIIDSDLQDPPEVVPEMIAKLKEGYDVVYAKRAKRHGESFMKLFTAKVFYRTLKALTDIEIPVDTGDFRVITQQVNRAICGMPEKNRYVRGMISWAGFRQAAHEYVRHERAAGSTKYTLKKMLRLAGDGIISFSNKPLKAPVFFGGALTGLSVLGFIAYLIVALMNGTGVGLTESLCFGILACLGGILMTLGLFGQYFSRMYDELKGRPVYLEQVLLNFPEENK